MERVVSWIREAAASSSRATRIKTASSCEDIERRKLIYWFVVFNEPDLLEEAIQLGLVDNTKELENWSTLHAAAKTGNVKSIELLLARGLKMTGELQSDDKDFDGSTIGEESPLHFAAKYGHPLACETLIRHGISIDVTNHAGHTPLHYATNEQVVEVLVQHGAAIHIKDEAGRTPLHIAVNEQVAEVLIRHGATVDAKDNRGRVPLHLAAKDKVAEVLIQHGAAVNATDERGQTPLGLAANEQVAEMLIRHGATINSTDNDGGTPLHHTTSDRVAELLIHHGADVHARTKEGNTPLHCTVRYPKVCQVLLQHGADLNSQNNKMRTPLAEAVYDAEPPIHPDSADGADTKNRNGTWTTCELLIERGASLEIPSDNPPVLYATHPAVIAMLLRHGANVHARDRFDVTVLHRVVRQYFVFDEGTELLELALKLGADPNCRNRIRPPQTPFEYFLEQAEGKDVAALELLFRYGADINLENYLGVLPLQRKCRTAFQESLNKAGGVPLAKYEPVLLSLIQEAARVRGKSVEWDHNVFRQISKSSPKIIHAYLDLFRVASDQDNDSFGPIKVLYYDVDMIYGPPNRGVNSSPLCYILDRVDQLHSLLSHPILDYVLDVKWRAFGRMVWGMEILVFTLLLTTTYWAFVSKDGVRGVSECRTTALVCCSILLWLEVLDWRTRKFRYFLDVTNWLNLITYVLLIVVHSVAFKTIDENTLVVPRAVALVLLCLCGIEYLRLVQFTSLLIAVMFQMVRDVAKFLILYAVFQIGFSGAFYMLLGNNPDNASRYGNFARAFVSTFFMLFGDFDAEAFLNAGGQRAVAGNVLLLAYLVSAMVMLLNLLIAMMSTSYQQVMESAKSARNVARAETVLRMERLMPKAVLWWKYKARGGRHDKERNLERMAEDKIKVDEMAKQRTKLSGTADTSISQKVTPIPTLAVVPPVVVLHDPNQPSDPAVVKQSKSAASLQRRDEIKMSSCEDTCLGKCVQHIEPPPPIASMHSKLQVFERRMAEIMASMAESKATQAKDMAELKASQAKDMAELKALLVTNKTTTNC